MIKTRVAVIDYGVGNLRSVQQGIEHVGGSIVLTSDAKQIINADRVILPGVGAFHGAMQSLRERNLIKVINEVAEKSIPLLGICLGMQLLFDESEEFGINRGLGLIPGRVVAIPAKNVSGSIQRVPHNGWNTLIPSNQIRWNESILEGIKPNNSMYFVHSYMAQPSNSDSEIAFCEYGGYKICAAVAKDKIVGCQFHPEKSGELGLNILLNFIKQ